MSTPRPAQGVAARWPPAQAVPPGAGPAGPRGPPGLFPRPGLGGPARRPEFRLGQVGDVEPFAPLPIHQGQERSHQRHRIPPLQQVPGRLQVPGRVHCRHLVGQAPGPGFPDLPLGGHRPPFELQPTAPGPGQQDARFLEAHQGQGGALGAGAPGAPGAVDVALQLGGDAQVHHQRHGLHVDAPGRHVGGHEVAQLAPLELGQDAVAHLLAQVPVQAVRRQPRVPQGLGHLLGGDLHPGEDQRRGRLVRQQEVHQGLGMQVLGHQAGGVGDVRVLGGAFRLGVADAHRVLEEALGQGGDGGGQRGREQVGLLPRGHVREDLLHILQEAHVQHLVTLVQHHHGHPRQVQGAPVQVVLDPAGGAHHHPGAALEGLQLRHVAEPAHQQGGLQARGHAPQLGRHLLGQFPGGREDDGLDLPAILEAVQQGQAEGQGLARAGAALHQQVATPEAGAEGLRLDLGGGGEAAPGEGGQERFRTAQGCEGIKGQAVSRGAAGSSWLRCARRTWPKHPDSHGLRFSTRAQPYCGVRVPVSGRSVARVPGPRADPPVPGFVSPRAARSDEALAGSSGPTKELRYR